MKRRGVWFAHVVLATSLWTLATAQAQDTITNTSQFSTVFDQPGLSFPLASPFEGTFQPMDTWFVDFSALTNAIGAVTNYPGQTQNGVTVWPLRLIQAADTGEVVLKYAGTNEAELLRLAAPTGYAPFQTYDAMLPSFCILSCAMNPTNYDALIADGYTFLAPPRVVIDAWVVSTADEDAYLSYESSAGWGEFTAMSGDASPMFLDGDPCSITNDAQPFSIVGIYQDTNLYTTITWESCTNFTYTVLSADELSFDTAWAERAMVPGEANTTSWTDTTTTNVAVRFYKVERMHFNEWNGPFASWTNLTAFGATGNGVTDDTAAVSNAFASIGLSGCSPVLYVPNGTYKITKTINFAVRDGVRVVGQDPAHVIFKASGSLLTGGPQAIMFHPDRTPRSSFERITFDGGGATYQTLVYQGMTTDTLFNTGMQYLECVWTNGDYGLITGINFNGDSEISIVRCKFSNLLDSGLVAYNFNSLDIWVQDSEIDHCYDGLSTVSGAFNAYGCLFHDNTYDLYISATEPFFGFRDNLSTNSEQFLFAEPKPGHQSAVTLQRNLIVDPKIMPCVDVGNEGQLALIDNTFLTTSNAVVAFSVSGGDMLSVSNQFTAPNAETNVSSLISIDDQTIPRPTNSGTLVLSSVATNVQRYATNLWNSATTADIQAAIYAVTNRIGQKPIVHIPWGTYDISSTLVVPGGADIQIEGDSAFGATPTELTWSGNLTGLVMQLGSPGNPTMAALRNIEINCGGNAVTGIVANVSNGKLWSRRLFLQNDTEFGHGICLLARGCTNATIDLLDFEHAGGSNNVVVDNCSAPIRIRGGASGNAVVVYSLTNTVNLCVEDIWFEGSVSNRTQNAEAENDFIHATGATGTFTIQGFHAVVTRTNGPIGECAIFTNWNGVALISQGKVYDKVVPASGSGSLWLNGLEYSNVTNAFSTSGILTNFNANNCQNPGDGQIADFMALNTNLVRSTMSQVRSTKALQNPDPGSAIMESVAVNKSIVGLLVQ